VVKVRDGQVTNKPFDVVIGVTTAGERDILGVWAGDGNEGAKYWLAELKTRGVEDVCIVCDGLKGLPDAITTHLAACRGTDLRDPPVAQHLPLRRPARLGRHGQGPAPGIHRSQRRPRRATAGDVRRQMGRQVPGRREAVAIGVDRVHPVPGLRPGDPMRHLHDG
jgi:hypothetical protein